MTASRRGGLGELTGHTAVYLLGSLAAKLASLLLIPIFTPLLEKPEYGILELTDATLGILLQLVGFQLDAALTRHYVGAPDEATRRRVVSTAFITVLCATSLAVTPLLIAPARFAEWLLGNAELTNVVRLVALILAGIVLAEVPLAVLKAEKRSLAATAWQLVRLVAELGLKILCVVSFGLGVTGVLLGQAVPSLIFLLGAAAWLVARHGWGFDKAICGTLLRYSSPMVLAGLCQFVLHSGDRFLFREFSNLDELGDYGIGYKLGYAVTSVLLSAFLLIWYPFIFGAKDATARAAALERAAVLVPAVLLTASLPVALLAPEVVALLADPKFHSAWRIVPVVLFSYLFWGLFQIVQTPFYVASRTGEVPRVVILAALVNLGLNVVLLPRFGGLGAAFATLASLVLLALLARRAAQGIEAFAIDWRRLATLLVPCAVAAFALYGAAGGPFALTWRCATLLVLWLWLGGGFLRRDERVAITELVRSKFARGSE